MSSANKSVWAEFTKGLLKENPILVIMLGCCPTLAVTTCAINGIGMGAAATFVLLCSNIFIAVLKGVIPGKVRIPVFIVIAAGFTTIVDLLMHAFTPDLYKALGIFIPLIVVNCIILGRAEAFASKNGILPSIADALGMGLGWTLMLVFIGSFREFLGSGTVLAGTPLETAVFGENQFLLLILPPGGFILMGFIMAFSNRFLKKSA